MSIKHKTTYAARKVKQWNITLNNNASPAHPTQQARFGRAARHWDRELQYREAVQERRWAGRDKPDY